LVEGPPFGGLCFGVLFGKSEVHARENTLGHRRGSQIPWGGPGELRPVNLYAEFLRVPPLQSRPSRAFLRAAIGNEKVNLVEPDGEIERGALDNFDLYAVRAVDVSAVYPALRVGAIANHLHAFRFHPGYQRHTVFHQKADVIYRGAFHARAGVRFREKKDRARILNAFEGATLDRRATQLQVEFLGGLNVVQVHVADGHAHIVRRIELSRRSNYRKQNCNHGPESEQRSSHGIHLVLIARNRRSSGRTVAPFATRSKNRPEPWRGGILSVF